MRADLPYLHLVAFAFVACGPRAAPQGPGTQPQQDGGVVAQPAGLVAPVQEVLIGEMCPDRAAGRAAVMPIFVRRVGWSSASDELIPLIERRSARQFAVHGWDGGRAGVFAVAGLADVGLDRRVAVGAYAGSSPCQGDDDEPDAECVVAQGHCGLAISILEAGSGFKARPFAEDPDPTSLPIAGACVAGGKLIVDIDDDGSAEAYPVGDFLDPVRAPAEEVAAVNRDKLKCTPHFAIRGVIPAADPKHWRGLDLLGVIDIDGDGRFELIVSYHYSDRRTWAIYSAAAMVGRLELVGEAIPWPRP